MQALKSTMDERYDVVVVSTKAALKPAAPPPSAGPAQGRCLAVLQVPQTLMTAVGGWRLVPGPKAGAVKDLSSAHGAQGERCINQVPRVAPVGLEDTVELHVFRHSAR